MSFNQSKVATPIAKEVKEAELHVGCQQTHSCLSPGETQDQTSYEPTQVHAQLVQERSVPITLTVEVSPEMRKSGRQTFYANSVHTCI